MNNLIIKKFVKDKSNDGSDIHSQYGIVAGSVGIITNLILVIMKISVGIISSSISIIADGVNNLTDAASSLITLIGFKLSARPEDKKHPYGHARIEYISGIIVSCIIIFAGVSLLSSSIKKFIHPEVTSFNTIAIIILVISVLLKIWQMQFYLFCAKRINSPTLKAAGTDSRNDVVATSTVLLCALISLKFDIDLDAAVGGLISLFIIYSGIQLIIETSSPLLGEAPPDDLVKKIYEIALSHTGVLGLHDLVVHSYGAGRIFASVHIEVDAEGDILESHDLIDNVEKEISGELGIHFVVHMDPIVVHDPLIEKLRIIIQRAIDDIEYVEDMHDLRCVKGSTHTNVIFDLVRWNSCKKTEEEIKQIISDEINSQCEGIYYLVITFDSSYTSI